MGNLRFRLSNIMPNAWFYKLKYMSAGSGAGTRTTSHKRRNTNKFPRNSPPSPPPSSTPSKPNQPHHHNQYSYSRKSYYFTRDLHPPTPRKSSKLRAAKRRPPSDAARPPSPKLVSSSVSGGCSCRANWTKSDSPAVVVVAGDHSVSLSGSDSDSFPPELRSDCSLTTESFDKMVSWSSNSFGCPLELADSGSNDIIIDIDKRSLADPVRPALDSLPDRDLPRILTKPSSFDDRIEETKQEAARKQSRSSSPAKKVHDSKTRALSSLSTVKVGREENLTARQQGRKSNSANSPGIKLRVNSPRIGYRRSVHGQGRKSVTSSSTTTTTTTRSSSSSSFSSSCSGASASKKSLSGCLAVVKSSFDPQTDFRESMVEMIVENNLSGSKDLEDLLVCYLSLNSDEYHGVIIKVFKQIWIDYITNSRSK